VTAAISLTHHDVRSPEPVIHFDSARALASRSGTPLLAVSRSRLMNAYREMKSSLPNVELHYAAKANPDVTVLSILSQAGASVDVCSYREVQSALVSGFSTEQMLHTHPCKTEDNLRRCYQAGLRMFTFDCEYEIPKFVRHAPEAKVLLRLRAAAQSSRINLSDKFGCAAEDAVELALAAVRRGVNVCGLSFHVGSQCTDPKDFLRTLTQVRTVWEECRQSGVHFEVLDVGGGFPAPYRSDVLPLQEYCRYIASAIDQTFGDLDVRLIAEPGRGLCAEAVTLIASVIGKSVRNGRPWYIIDDGLYGSFSGKLFDHTDFQILSEASETRDCRLCVVAGPTCDSHDVVSVDQELPDLEIGELILVPTMGAYTSASACGFNGLDSAPLIEVD